MSFTLNTAQIYNYWSNLETVTLYDRFNNLLATVTGVKRLMQDVCEVVPADGRYPGLSIDFRLPQPNVPSGVTIMPGYTIVDGALNRYIVQEVDNPSTYNNPWMCFCLELSVLDYAVTVTSAQTSTDAYTSALTTQATIISGAPAAIIDYKRVPVDFQHKLGFREYYWCWLLTDVNVPYGSLLTDNNGVQYIIEEIEQRTRIDQLIRLTMYVNP